MRKNFLLYGLTITILLFAALTVQADDDVTTRRNDDGSWTVVKPAGMDLKIEVVYYTKKELDSIAALNYKPALIEDLKAVTDADDEEVDDEDEDDKVDKKKSTKVKNNRSKRSRSRHGRSRRSRRR